MKISIIIPTYNRAKFIEKAIESVLNQTSNSYELVVCDNNSTDNTQEIVKKFESDKIKYIKFSKTLQVSENWERALDYISGDFFIILGDDDYLMPNFIEEITNLLEDKKDADFIIVDSTNYSQFDPVGGMQNLLFIHNYEMDIKEIDPIEVANSYQTINVFKKSFQIAQLHPSVFVVNTTIMNKIRKKYNGYFKNFFPDWIANVLLGINSKKAYLISKPLVIIGGFDNKYYCYNNSKDSYFLLKSLAEKEKKEILNIILNLPYLKSFMMNLKNIHIWLRD